MARALQPSERNYSATKKELLAIVFALNRFYYYLWGGKFTLYTDHKALIYLHTLRTLNHMMTTWLDTLAQFDFTVVHRPGILNILPDCTSSRLFPSFFWGEGNNYVNDTKNRESGAKLTLRKSPTIQQQDFTRLKIPLQRERYKHSQFIHAKLPFDHCPITLYEPKANGLVERIAQTFLHNIEKRIQGTKKDEDRYLPVIQHAINAEISAIHNSTPFSLMYGQKANNLLYCNETEIQHISPPTSKKRLQYSTDNIYSPISKRAKIQKVVQRQKFDSSHAMSDALPHSKSISRVPLFTKLHRKIETLLKALHRNTRSAYSLEDTTRVLFPTTYAPVDIVPDDSHKSEATFDRKDLNSSWEPHSSFDDHKIIDEYWKRNSSTNGIYS